MSKARRFLAVLCMVTMLFGNVAPTSNPVFASGASQDNVVLDDAVLLEANIEEGSVEQAAEESTAPAEQLEAVKEVPAADDQPAETVQGIEPAASAAGEVTVLQEAPVEVIPAEEQAGASAPAAAPEAAGEVEVLLAAEQPSQEAQPASAEETLPAAEPAATAEEAFVEAELAASVIVEISPDGEADRTVLQDRNAVVAVQVPAGTNFGLFATAPSRFRLAIRTGDTNLETTDATLPEGKTFFTYGILLEAGEYLISLESGSEVEVRVLKENDYNALVNPPAPEQQKPTEVSDNQEAAVPEEKGEAEAVPSNNNLNTTAETIPEEKEPAETAQDASQPEDGEEEAVAILTTEQEEETVEIIPEEVEKVVITEEARATEQEQAVETIPEDAEKAATTDEAQAIEQEETPEVIPTETEIELNAEKPLENELEVQEKQAEEAVKEETTEAAKEEKQEETEAEPIEEAAEAEPEKKETAEAEAAETAEEPEEVQEEEPALFEGTLTKQGYDFTVTAVITKEAGFPADVTLRVREVWPGTAEYKTYLGLTDEELSKDWNEVGDFARILDISFWSGDVEVQPQAYIDVQVTFHEAISVDEESDLKTFHFGANGTEEMSSQTSSEGAAKHDDSAVDSVSFSTNSFSVYVFVKSNVTKTKTISANGKTYEISVTYSKDAKIPDTAEVKVSEITESNPDYEYYRMQAAAALKSDDVIMPGLYDISLYDGQTKIEPADPVQVSIRLADAVAVNSEEELHIVHFPDGIEAAKSAEVVTQQIPASPEATEDAPQENKSQAQVVNTEVIQPTVEGQTVTFDAQSFSVYALAYTVDFEYNGYQFSMPGGGVLLLSELFEQLHIDEDVADVEDVTFTDYSLLKVEYAESDIEIKERKPVTEEITMDDVLALENDSILSVAAEYDTRVIPAGEWIITSLQPFDTYHRLTIVSRSGAVYEINVTDAYDGTAATVRLQDVVTDGSGDTTKTISVKLTEGGSISDMSRTASLKLRVSYVLTAANLQAMQTHAAVAGNDIPTIVYDFSSALTNSALADAIQTDTITLTDEGKNVGTVTIGANGVVTIQFTDKDWFAERTQLGGYFDLDLQVDTTQINEGQDDHWLFPGAPEIGPIHYKDVLSNGGKAFSAQKLKDENGKDYYLIDYTASIYVNSDVTNVTFEDTLMTDGVAGGIQDLVWGSAKLDGESVDVNSVTPKNGDWKQGFNLSIPSLTTGQHTVTYQVKIPASAIEGMTEGGRKDAVNKAEWKLTGDKTIPGGETHYVIEKPYRDVEVHKTAPETADPDGYVHYTITFGDSQTPLKNLVIMDSITDIQQLQGQIAIKVPGRADVNIDGSVNCTDANYSTGMTQLFWYKFGEDDTGYGPVTVEYTTKMINATTARQNGIFDAVNAINTAYEERTYKSDSTTTTVEFPHAPNITVDKTATVSPEDVDADGNWKPGATVQYTVTIGEAGEDLSYIRFSDQMSGLLKLTDDISVTVNGSTDSEAATAFKNALETSRNSATTGTLFDFTAPAGTTAPIVITYTTHLSSVAEAKAAQIYGDQHVSNHISVGNEHDDEGSDVHYPNEYELTKSERHDAKGTDGTQTIHWTVEYGDGVNNDMGGARIYDEMTKAQKLVAGSVKVNLSEDLLETITWPDGTVWKAGSTGPFDMPEATAKTATDGVVWTKFYSTDTNYSLSEMVPVFNLKLPDGFGTQKVTVAYDTVVISDREAMAANITGTQNVYNRATVGHSSDMETVEHDFPTITEHKPKVEKAFSRFDFENRLVYWTIAVSADIANGSGYPLTNVEVVEPTKNSSIQYHIDNVKVYNTDGTVVANNTVDVHTEDFDLSKISVVTESGVTLEPGVDYTIDYSNTSWIGNGAPTIHFPELNEKIYITIAYSTGNNDIINGFSGNNKINVFSDGGNDDATAVTSYTSSDIDVTKIGQTDPKNRIIKWKVTINPQKLACALEDTIWFDDDIPSGHILVDYNAANSVFKTFGSFDASTATTSPSINVYCSEYNNWVVKSLDATEYANQSIHANIIRSDPTNSSNLWRLSGKTYEVEYYTWVDDTKWAEITSGLSGSEKVTNTATIHVGDVLIGEGTGSTTVSVEEVITKTDITTVYDDGSGNSVVSTSTTELTPTSTLTYKIDINPNREQLTEAGKKLSLTDTLNTKMELQTDSIVLYYYPIDSEGNEGARTIATSAIAGFEDLTISYNDDTRTMSIGGIPDMMHCELEYSTTARALGTQSYSNTATLIGGGSHSHTITETHTVQYGSGGVTSRRTSLKLKKFDENDVTHAIQGAQFELYECTLAGGVLSDWTTTRTNPDPAVSGDTTEITVLDTAKISAAISDGPGNADYEKLLQDFKIVSWTKSGETKTTNEKGLVTFQPVYEDKVYYWKETATASGYDTAEIGVHHYFVLYPEKYANNTDGHTIGDVYPDEERARRRAEAKALDDACSLANGLTIACMVSDNGTTWNVNNIENGYTSISATKEWQGDSNNFFKTRPTEGILLDLYKVYPDGTRTLVVDKSPIPLNADNEGNWPIVTWSKLPKTETLPSGQVVNLKYTVVERPVTNYTTEYSDGNEGVTSGQVTVTNTLIPVNTRISVKKVFDQGIANLPDQIIVKLWQICTDKNGVVTHRFYDDDILSTSNNWQYTWKALPTRDDKGNTFTYTVTEDVDALREDGFYFTAIYSDEGEGVTSADTDDPLIIRNIENGLRIVKTLGGDGSLLTDAMKQQIRLTVEKVGGTSDEKVTFTLADMTVGEDGKLEKILSVSDYGWIDDGSLNVTEINPNFKHFGVKSVSYTINGGTTSVVTDDLGRVVMQNVTLQDGASGLLEITNEYEEEKTELPVQKLWQDVSGETIAWPADVESVTVDLMKVVDDEEVATGESLTLDSAHTTGLFANLPKYEFNTDRLIEYTVSESVKGYTTTVTDGQINEVDGKIITNKKDQPKLYVEKVWDGSSSFIPASIQVQLFESDTKIDVNASSGWTAVGEPKTITAADNWQAAFEDLTEGKYYKVEEVGTVSGWTLHSYSPENGSAFQDLETITIINKRTPPPPSDEEITVGVQKIWTEDGKPVDAPVDDVKVKLVRYKAKPATESAILHLYYWLSSNGPIHITDLEVEKGESVSYGVTYSAKDMGGWSWTPNPTWYKVAPETFRTLDSNSCIPNIGNSITTTSFAVSDDELYLIAHENSQFYDTGSSRLFTITNHSPVEEGTGEEIWFGPEDYTYPNTESSSAYDAATKKLTLSADNGWQYEFVKLPKKGTEDGTKYIYRYAVVEDTVSGFTTSYTYENGERINLTSSNAYAMGTDGTVQVTNNRETTKITAKKKWASNVWPENVTQVGVKLTATISGDNGPVDITSTLGITAALNGNAVEAVITKPSSGNEASITWNRLPKKDNSGKTITYTIEETSVTMDGVTYTSSTNPSLSDMFGTAIVQPNSNGNATIINTKITGKITVTKEVKVDNDMDTEASDQRIWVGLYSDQAATTLLDKKEILITASGSGVVEFTNLTPGSYFVYEMTGENGTAITSGDTTIGGKQYTVTYSNAGSTSIDIRKNDLNKTVTITNTRQGNGKLTITKTFDGDHVSALTDEQKNAITFTVSGPSGFTSVTKTYAEIYAMTNQAWTLDNLEPGTYTVTEDNANPNSTAYTLATTYRVGDADYSETNTVLISAGNKKALNIKNTYTENPGSLKVTKTVTVNGGTPSSPNQNLVDGSYLFTVASASTPSTVLKYVQITVSDGAASSYKIATTQANLETATPVDDSWAVVNDLTAGDYVITEVAPTNGTTLTSASRGDNNSEAVSVTNRTVTVHVTAGDTTAAQANAQATFTNNKPYITQTPTVTKKLNGSYFTGKNSQNQDATFNFTLKHVTVSGTDVNLIYTVDSGDALQTVTTASNGSISFSAIEFTEQGTYIYQIAETGTDSHTMDYADPVYVKIVVTESNGVLTAGTPAYFSDIACTTNASAVFNNIELGELDLSKTVVAAAGSTLPSDSANQQFTFTIELTNANGLPAAVPVTIVNKTTNAEITPETDYTVTSGKITVVLKDNEKVLIKKLPVGTTYSITEATAAGYTLTWDTTNGASGTISTTTSQADATNTFTSAEYTPLVSKKLNGVAFNGKLGDGTTAATFTFDLKVMTREEVNDETVYTVAQSATQTKSTSASDGSVTFDAIKYNAAGTYYYKITEQGTDSATMDYDGKAVYLKVVVGNDLSVEGTYWLDQACTTDTAGSSATFENTELTQVSKNKAWGTGIWPADTTVTFTLGASIEGEDSYTIVDAIGNAVTLDQNATSRNATVTWTNLPKYYLDSTTVKLITYTVTEKSVTVGTGENAVIYSTAAEIAEHWDAFEDSDTITNTPTTTTVSGSKTWWTNGTPVGNPTVKLYQSVGSAAATVVKAAASTPTVYGSATGAETDVDLQPTWDGNTYTFAGLRRYNDAQQEYTYTVAETEFTVRVGETNYTYTVATDGTVTVPEGAPAFTYSQEGYNLTNTEVATASVNKVWTGTNSSLIESITYRIRRTVNGHPDTSYTPADVTVTSADSADWGYTWDKLPANGEGMYDNNGTSTPVTGVLAYTVEEVSFVYGGVTYNVTKSGTDYTVAADQNTVGKGETVGTWQTTASDNTFTNKLFGSVKVTKTFNFPSNSGLSVPDGFQITASWTIPAAVEGGTATTITANLITTENTAYTLPSDVTLPTGVTITRTGNGTAASPYTWTISNLPVGTSVTFTEENYTVDGYIVASTVSVNSASATTGITGTVAAAATPGTVAITNDYTAGVELPATGGPGTMIYTVAGLMLITLAGVLMINRRKKYNR